MRIELSAILNTIKGPLLVDGRPGYQLVTTPSGHYTIRKRRVGFGPAAQHKSVIYCQQAWQVLDAAWIALAPERKAEWGRCLKRSSTLSRSNLDQFRSINLTRMLLDMDGMTVPHDAFNSRKVYMTKADRDAIPEGKVLGVWIEGKDKEGNPFPPPHDPIPRPPDSPYPPDEPPPPECVPWPNDGFTRADAPTLGDCYVGEPRFGNDGTFAILSNTAHYAPPSLDEYRAQNYTREAPNHDFHVICHGIDWGTWEGDYRCGLQIHMNNVAPDAPLDGYMIRVLEWEDEDFEIILYRVFGAEEEEIDSWWTDFLVPTSVALHHANGGYVVSCKLEGEWVPFELGPADLPPHGYHGFGYLAEGARHDAFSVTRYEVAAGPFVPP